MTEYPCHFVAREHHGQSRGALRAHQLGHPLHAPAEDDFIEEQDGAESLILGGGADATGGQLRQKGRDLRFAHLLRMARATRYDKAPYPCEVRLFGARTVMPEPNGLTYTIEELGWGR